jgi:hypothetical protein
VLARHLPRLLPLQRLGSYYGTAKVGLTRHDPGLRYAHVYFDAFLSRLNHECDLRGESRSVAFVDVWPGQVVVGRA